MKTKILLVLLLLSQVGFGQREKTRVDFLIRKAKEVFTASDSLGNVAYIFQSGREYQVTLLNQDLEVIRNSKIMKTAQDKREEILGGVMIADNISVYFFSKKYKSISVLSYNTNTHTSSYARLATLDSDELFLNAIRLDEKFCVLTVPKANNSVKVKVFQAGSFLYEGLYEINFPSFYDRLISDNEKLNVEPRSVVGIERINYRLENKVKSTHSPKKLYALDGKIRMTFDEPDFTHLIVIDPIEKAASYKKLTFSLEVGNDSKYKKGNSFIYDNKLFRATYSPDMMNFSIIDLADIRLIKGYNFYPDKDIDILNGPILQQGGGNYSEDEMVIKNTSQLFKKMTYGDLAVAVNEAGNGSYSLEVGSYEELRVYSRNNNRWNNSGLNVGVNSGLGLGYPGYGWDSYGYPGYYYPYGSNNYTTTTKVVYFNSMLDTTSLEHVEGMPPKSLIEKVNDYEDNAFRYGIPEMLTIQTYKYGMVLGYYLRNQGKYQLVEFRK